MKKLLCDICNGALEMNTNGQGAVCVNCGMTYSTARLQEKLRAEEPVQQAEEEIVYEITDYEVVEAADNAKHFWMTVEHLFHVEGRGMVVVGRVQDASVYLNDQVTLIRADGSRLTTQVSAIERYHKLLDRADPGEAVGILLADTKPNQVSVEDVIAAAAEAKQSISDYYTVVRCKNCSSFLRVSTQWHGPLPNCPDCGTPFQRP